MHDSVQHAAPSRTARLGAATAVVLCLAVIAQAALPAHSSGTQAPPASLTSHGRVLWNFEGLLTKTFGRRQPLCVSGNLKLRTFWNFTTVAGGCSPLAKYLLYWYTFQPPHGTAFHIVRRKMRLPNFGNYPVAVLVRGHMVACDAQERHFLIDYASGAGLTLGCLPLQPK